MRTGKEKEECKQPHLKTDTIDLGNSAVFPALCFPPFTAASQAARNFNVLILRVL